MNASERITTGVGELVVRVVGNGPPAVLWHSLFVDERTWTPMLPALGPARRLVLITGPGHGRSSDPGRRYSLQECADAARRVLDAVDIGEPVDWVGNAWGGHVGALFAERWPSRCRSLVAFGMPVAALNRHERRTTYLLLALHRLGGPSRYVVDGISNVLLSARSHSTDPQAVQLVADCLRHADPRMLRNAVVSISLHLPELTATLQQLPQPVLLVTGAEHHGFSPEQAHAATRLLRRGEAAVVPDAAYLVPLEAPDACARLVLDFWASHSVPTAAPHASPSSTA